MARLVTIDTDGSPLQPLRCGPIVAAACPAGLRQAWAPLGRRLA